MSEAIYDELIAPELLRLSKLAFENGISLLAVAEWEPGETGRTVCLVPNSSFAVRMVEVAMRCDGNVDAFMLAMMKHAREHGHSSMFLSQAGVPTAPEAKGRGVTWRS